MQIALGSHLAQSTTHQMKVAKPKAHPSLSLRADYQKPMYFLYFDPISFGRPHLDIAEVKDAAEEEDWSNKEELGDASHDVESCWTHFWLQVSNIWT